VNEQQNLILLSFDGFSSNFDKWVSRESLDLAPHGKFSKVISAEGGAYRQPPARPRVRKEPSRGVPLPRAATDFDGTSSAAGGVPASQSLQSVASRASEPRHVEYVGQNVAISKSASELEAALQSVSAVQASPPPRAAGRAATSPPAAIVAPSPSRRVREAAPAPVAVAPPAPTADDPSDSEAAQVVSVPAPGRGAHVRARRVQLAERVVAAEEEAMKLRREVRRCSCVCARSMRAHHASPASAQKADLEMQLHHTLQALDAVEGGKEAKHVLDEDREELIALHKQLSDWQSSLQRWQKLLERAFTAAQQQQDTVAELQAAVTQTARARLDQAQADAGSPESGSEERPRSPRRARRSFFDEAPPQQHSVDMSTRRTMRRAERPASDIPRGGDAPREYERAVSRESQRSEPPFITSSPVRPDLDPAPRGSVSAAAPAMAPPDMSPRSASESERARRTQSTIARVRETRARLRALSGSSSFNIEPGNERDEHAATAAAPGGPAAPSPKAASGVPASALSPKSQKK
jgi:hypothetical protein